MKTLEEPPEHVKFMFATTEPEKILPTILSRCQRYDLRRIPAPLIIEHLNMIAGKEGVEVEEDALKAVARGCEGCMRDAESILDQLISFCGKKITETDVLGMFGLTSRTQIMDLIRALLNQDPQEVLHIIEDLHAAGKDTTRLLSDLIAELRDVWVIRIQATHTKSREQGPQIFRIRSRMFQEDDGNSDRLRIPPSLGDFQKNPVGNQSYSRDGIGKLGTDRQSASDSQRS